MRKWSRPTSQNMPKQNNEPSKDQPRSPGKSGLEYAGLATQLLVALGLGVFIGLKVDHWLHWRIPVAIWVLPLLILAVMLVRLVRDTGTGK